MTFGLVTTVYAEDGQARQELGQLAASDTAATSTAQVAGLITEAVASAKLPQTATRADEQIVRGIATLLAAMMGASGLAIWRRRVRGIFAGAKS